MSVLQDWEELLDRHPYDLSGGEQQRLALAKVLLLRPQILLMDEPTKGMDAEYKEELGKILKKLQQHGMTVFMISHDVEFVAEVRRSQPGLFFEGNVVTSKETREFLQEITSIQQQPIVWPDSSFQMQLQERSG